MNYICCKDKSKRKVKIQTQKKEKKNYRLAKTTADCEYVATKKPSWVLTGALGHTDGPKLELGVGVGLQPEGVLVVNEGHGALRYTGARVVKLPASL